MGSHPTVTSKLERPISTLKARCLLAGTPLSSALQSRRARSGRCDATYATQSHPQARRASSSSTAAASTDWSGGRVFGSRIGKDPILFSGQPGRTRAETCAQEKEKLDPRVWKVADVAALGPIITNIDSTVVNVALSALGQDLHAPLTTLQWVITGWRPAYSSTGELAVRLATLVLTYGIE
jgi:hypothetical protein